MSEEAKKPKQPQDHKKPAAQVEAEETEWVTIHAASMDFKIPADVEELDGEFLLYAANQDSYRMTQVVLSDNQFNEFRKINPKIRDYNELGKQIARVYGFDTAGE